MDVRAEAIKPLKSGDIAIVPGDVAKSKLVERIETKDEDDMMPPPKSGKKLTSAQKEIFKQWIAQGAKYAEHWAFVKPERPKVPEVRNTRWPKNDIDSFVAARLEKEKISPSLEAEKTTLIRRATLDLTGLPPTPSEVDAFLSDARPEAYEMLVDRLLDSPQYGEQMGRIWLDAARYADSHGFHIDSDRSIWKYREWVINAFNKNMPFDQFTVEQIGGDLLPKPTVDQKIASGYVRCNMSTGEGGAIVEEYQAKYTFDRVETTATVWMGLTLTCARCHTHKFDPIQHKEYYALYSIFNNLDESVMDGNQPHPDPFIKVPSTQQSEREAELKEWLAKGQKDFEASRPELDKAQAAWEKKWRDDLASIWFAPEPKVSTTNSNATTFSVSAEKSIFATGTGVDKETYEFRLQAGAGTFSGLRLETLPHESTPKKTAARSEDGKFRVAEIEAEVIPAKGGSGKKLKFAQALADFAEAGNEAEKAIDGKAETGWSIAEADGKAPHSAVFVLQEPLQLSGEEKLVVRLSFATKTRALAHFRLQLAKGDRLAQLLNPPKFEAWSLLGPLKTDNIYKALDTVYDAEKDLDFKKGYPGVREEVRWSKRPNFVDGKPHEIVNQLHGVHGVYYAYRTINLPYSTTMDISVRADDVFKLFLNGKVVAERRVKEKPGDGPVRFAAHLQKGETKLLLKMANEVDGSAFTFNYSGADLETLPPDIAMIFVASASQADSAEKLQAFFRKNNSPELKELARSLDHWREEQNAIEKNIPTTMVAKEMSKPRDAFILIRGEYDHKGEKVSPGVPAIFPPLPKDLPPNRLALAKWLVSGEHPLTARVAVNRFWQLYFGVGLVKTAEDFGVQGENPSHPELLDWLATEFMANGWDMKRMQKLIVTSATYRQSSKGTPEMFARDPENRLLARGPRFRVDAEVVRDTALSVSGLLAREIGGASVKPYEPAGLWEAVSFNNSQKYVQDTDDGQYRRSLYTYWKRQSPPPNMLLLDAPTREFCVVRRPRTNTPLQALALLNDPQFVEASRAFAERILREGGASVDARLAFAFRLVTARRPSDDEMMILKDTLKQQLAAYQKNPEGAEKYLRVGGYKPKAKVDASELAAWSTVASMLLNLDETLTKG